MGLKSDNININIDITTTLIAQDSHKLCATILAPHPLQSIQRHQIIDPQADPQQRKGLHAAQGAQLEATTHAGRPQALFRKHEYHPWAARIWLK